MLPRKRNQEEGRIAVIAADDNDMGRDIGVNDISSYPCNLTLLPV